MSFPIHERKAGDTHEAIPEKDFFLSEGLHFKETDDQANHPSLMR